MSHQRVLRMPVKRLLVCGSRTMRREHMPLIRRELERAPKDVVIVHGAQGVFKPCDEYTGQFVIRYQPVPGIDFYVYSGADYLADEVAQEFGLAVERHPAEWDKLGKQAGFIRNIEMLKTGVDYVLAFWDGRSPGTAHTLRAAKHRGIPTRIVGFAA
jgi:hypothetical protein